MSFRTGGFANLPPVTRNLLIANVVLFIISFSMLNAGIQLSDILGLHLFAADKFRPYQVITHMFMHGSFIHLFFNMFLLYMFGGILERLWGSKRFLIFYFATGLGAAILYSLVGYFNLLAELNLVDAFLENRDFASLQALFEQHNFIIYGGDGLSESRQLIRELQAFSDEYSRAITQNAVDNGLLTDATAFVNKYRDYRLNLPVAVGASGAIYGLIAAYGYIFPNQLLYLYFLVPIKAKYAAIGLIALEFYFTLTNPGDGIAHAAHLGGAIIAILLLLYWKQRKMN